MAENISLLEKKYHFKDLSFKEIFNNTQIESVLVRLQINLLTVNLKQTVPLLIFIKCEHYVIIFVMK